jgi:hypothetical protein
MYLKDIHVFNFCFRGVGEKTKIPRKEVTEESRFYFLGSWQQSSWGQGYEKISYSKERRLHKVSELKLTFIYHFISKVKKKTYSNSFSKVKLLIIATEA